MGHALTLPSIFEVHTRIKMLQTVEQALRCVKR
jgi:hypothetical protein